MIGKGRMLRLIGTSGNRHDLIGAFDLIDGFSDATILADKAYDSDECLEFIDECGLESLHPRRNQIEPLQNPITKATTNTDTHVENFFTNESKKNGPLQTRYEKTCHPILRPSLPLPQSVIGS